MQIIMCKKGIYNVRTILHQPEDTAEYIVNTFIKKANTCIHLYTYHNV